MTDHEASVIKNNKKYLPFLTGRLKREVKNLFMQPTKVAYFEKLTGFQKHWTSQFSYYYKKNIHVAIDKLGFWACYGDSEITTLNLWKLRLTSLRIVSLN
jgi:hypothetical protein